MWISFEKSIINLDQVVSIRKDENHPEILIFIFTFGPEMHLSSDNEEENNERFNMLKELLLAKK